VHIRRSGPAGAGVADRISYHVLDAAAGLPESFDVITTFNVVHDAVDPLGLLRSIREALRPLRARAVSRGHR
jgi:hypothetical protein